MDDVRKLAEERAARPSSVPAGSSFESEKKKKKAALVRQIDELDGSKIRKISAASEKDESNKTLRVAAYCRVSTDDIDQAISIELQMRQYKVILSIILDTFSSNKFKQQYLHIHNIVFS